MGSMLLIKNRFATAIKILNVLFYLSYNPSAAILCFQWDFFYYYFFLTVERMILGWKLRAFFQYSCIYSYNCCSDLRSSFYLAILELFIALCFECYLTDVYTLNYCTIKTFQNRECKHTYFCWWSHTNFSRMWYIIC